MKQPSNWSLLVGIVVVLSAIGLADAPAAMDVAQETAETTSAEEAPVKKVKMYARNWKWTPEEIRVKRGTRVIIDFVSEDASHAFELKAYKIKVNLPQDKRGQVEFVANKTGTFRWRCSRPCGNGCPKMTGKLIVMD
jgi:cytochrome c oxidase subunit 2